MRCFLAFLMLCLCFEARAQRIVWWNVENLFDCRHDSLKEISARLKTAYKSAYQEDEGCYIKISNFLSRPEHKFESNRKVSGMVNWVKER